MLIEISGSITEKSSIYCVFEFWEAGLLMDQHMQFHDLNAGVLACRLALPDQFCLPARQHKTAWNLFQQGIGTQSQNNKLGPRSSLQSER